MALGTTNQHPRPYGFVPYDDCDPSAVRMHGYGHAMRELLCEDSTFPLFRVLPFILESPNPDHAPRARSR